MYLQRKFVVSFPNCNDTSNKTNAAQVEMTKKHSAATMQSDYGDTLVTNVQKVKLHVINCNCN